MSIKGATDRGGIFRIVLDLATQAADADIDRPIEWFPFPVTRKREQLIPRQDAIRVLDECFQRIEFHARQLDLLPVSLEQPMGVDIERTPPNRFSRGTPLTQCMEVIMIRHRIVLVLQALSAFCLLTFAAIDIHAQQTRTPLHSTKQTMIEHCH